MKMKDFKNYDYLSVSVKTDSEKEMISRYGAFGWEVLDRADDSQYSNISVVNFRRPHAMPNKDRLQYLQVAMETIVNNWAKSKSKKHALSCGLGLSSFIIGGGLIAGGVALAVLISALWAYLVAGCSVLAGICLFIAATVTLIRLIPKENARFDKLSDETQKQLLSIDAEAAELIKVNYGE